ncbi:hypothetical protein [Hymenobacter actinosclerus]|uniref:Uncharacterized protein n=1 Tax=Hymenobacter actinosclerus TaxID=82805 RepID=A0A1I0IQ31_9BACT|nr:hypothetical protein [Hymenobacter actinosclerus]SET98564.1 hypothetical protein SAMN04487998_3403 [Hymenobacter actinosclerus]
MLKHKFETWLEKQTVSRNVEPLFSESIKCYKAEAYRASLLFSYLAFMNILKERIIGAHRPAVYEQGKWDFMLGLLRNDEKWEEALLNATQAMEAFGPEDPVTKVKPKTRDAIFAIKPTIRQQIMYWKDRRNDCAHAKDNIINNYHVETFWAFLESNLSKITVQGGMRSLLNKLKTHYDPTFTPPNQDVTPLVAEIPSSVEPAERDEFWRVAFSIIQTESPFFGEENVLINKVLALQDAGTTNSLAEFLKQSGSKRLLLSYLSENPSFIALLDYTPAEIRSFWNTTLSRAEKPLAIYASMLANALIPKDEIDSANRVVFGIAREYTDDVQQHVILEANGFGKIIEEGVFTSNSIVKYLWTNERADLIRGFIEHYPLTDVVVKKLSSIYNSGTYSYWLRERLEDLFKRKDAKKQEFKALVAAGGYTLPSHLPSLA